MTILSSTVQFIIQRHLDNLWQFYKEADSEDGAKLLLKEVEGKYRLIKIEKVVTLVEVKDE